jgi:hypothetical protein
MFARSYFAGAFYAPRYYPPVTALVELDRPQLGITEFLTMDREAWIRADQEIAVLITLFLTVIDDPE